MKQLVTCNTIELVVSGSSRDGCVIPRKDYSEESFVRGTATIGTTSRPSGGTRAVVAVRMGAKIASKRAKQFAMFGKYVLQ